MSQRTERIDELLRQEIGEILSREVGDPRIGFVTVTDVETAPDLRHARVWVSVIAPQGEREAALAALGRAMSFVRRELGTRLRLKRIPELHVRLDDTAQRGTRVLQLLHELEEGRTPEELPAPDESLPTPLARLPHEGDAPAEPPEWAEDPATRRRQRRGATRGSRAGGPRPGDGRPAKARRSGGRS